jgi:hypothetical protein
MLDKVNFFFLGYLVDRLCFDFNYADKKHREVYERNTDNAANMNGLVARVTLSCPERGEHGRKLTFLPKSLEELLDLGAKMFDISPTKILTKEGAEIDDIDLIRDGDHLIIAND